MAIDTKSLTQLITEFRKLQAKDSITPESLGYILQRIADLLATAGTSDTVEKLQTLLNGFNTAGRAIVSIAQGKSDRNHVYANINYVSLVDGHTAASNDNLFIQQATTERAGAMRAQQVIDLNAARKGISTLEQGLAEANKIIDALAAKLGLDGGKGVYTNAQITCTIRNGVLHVLGAQNLISNGYVPYLSVPCASAIPTKIKTRLPNREPRRNIAPPPKDGVCSARCMP